MKNKRGATVAKLYAAAFLQADTLALVERLAVNQNAIGAAQIFDPVAVTLILPYLCMAAGSHSLIVEVGQVYVGWVARRVGSAYEGGAARYGINLAGLAYQVWPGDVGAGFQALDWLAQIQV